MNKFDRIQYPAPKQEYKLLIRCYTYNQSKYIEDSLNGFAMQNTNFPFVCVVVDDASMDGEQKVIKTWMERECDMCLAETIDIPTSIVIIVPHKTNTSCTFAFYLLKQNLYKIKGAKKQHVDPWREKCEYEALCEGDDYWIDPLKLQKQVDFLENHSDFSMCFHKSMVIRETSNINKSYLKLYNHLEEREYSGEEILRKWTIPTASVVYRNRVIIPSDKRFVNGDIIIFLSCVETGRIFCLNDAMSVYRRHEGGVSYKRMHFKKYMELYDAIVEHFGMKYERIAYELKILNYVKCFIGSRNDINYIKEIVKDVYCNKCIIPFTKYLIRSISFALFEKLCNRKLT